MDLIEHRKYRDGILKRHPWELARLLFVKDLFSEYHFHKKNKLSLVADIGCGDGFVVSEFAKNYSQYDFIGNDINFTKADIRDLAIEYKLPNLYFSDTFLKGSAPKNLIGCILLLDVLEHIENDKKFLSKLINRPEVAKDALIIITVPSFMKLFSYHDELLKHFRRYNLKDLDELASSIGLNVMEKGYYFFAPLLLRYLEVLKQKLNIGTSQYETGISKWRGGRYLTTIITKLLYIDAVLCRKLNRTGKTIWGLSCYIICQRRA